MKTKIAILLVVFGIVASFGATKIKSNKTEQKSELASSTRSTEPKGGFVSEQH